MSNEEKSRIKCLQIITVRAVRYYPTLSKHNNWAFIAFLYLSNYSLVEKSNGVDKLSLCYHNVSTKMKKIKYTSI